MISRGTCGKHPCSCHKKAVDASPNYSQLMILGIFSCYPSEERWGKHSDPPWVVSPWLVKAEVSKRKTASAQKANPFLLDSTISTIQQRSTEYLNGGYNWQEFTQMMYCTLYILVPFRYTDDALFEIWAQVSKKPRTVSGFLEEDPYMWAQSKSFHYTTGYNQLGAYKKANVITF